MSAHAGDIAIDSHVRSGAWPHERSLEVAALLQAVTELHSAEMLTQAEYETKRQHLTACI